jgi:hypothetical protein
MGVSGTGTNVARTYAREQMLKRGKRNSQQIKRATEE